MQGIAAVGDCLVPCESTRYVELHRKHALRFGNIILQIQSR